MTKGNPIVTGIFTIIGMVADVIITYFCTIKAAERFVDDIDVFSFNKTWDALYYKYKDKGYDCAFHEEYHSVTSLEEIIYFIHLIPIQLIV